MQTLSTGREGSLPSFSIPLQSTVQNRERDRRGRIKLIASILYLVRSVYTEARKTRADRTCREEENGGLIGIRKSEMKTQE